MIEALRGHYPHLFLSLLLLLGLHGMLFQRNLLKKLIGMSILQSSIILFWLVIAAKDESTPPVLRGEPRPEPDDYANPLPHTLMLTAIVVAVVTLGVSFALLLRIRRAYGTLEEDVLLDARR